MAFCKNCGSQVFEGETFCKNCGASMATGSTWDGGVFETFVATVVTSLFIFITCGIATPWAICYMIKFITEHAVIDGRRLRFDGTGAQLFGNWIKWLVLLIITCGIYSFWVTPRLYKWIASHIHTAN
jgi:uncharacterized membrane protein YjgN (DUF898 family)